MAPRRRGLVPATTYPLLATTTALVVAASVFAGGGFDPLPRALFAGGAGVALLVAVRAGTLAARVARSAACLGLLALAALTALSATWTVGDPGEAGRWGLVLAGYAAIVIAGAVIADRGSRPIALILVGCAALSGALGLAAAGLGLEPFAERLGGSWRPGGSFEYPPALALVQIGALPFVARSMLRASPPVATVAAAAAAVAVAVLTLSQSRLALALALGTVLLILLEPRPAAERHRVGALVVWLAVVAVVAAWSGGGLAQPGDRGAGELLEMAAIVTAVALLWAPIRSLHDRIRARRRVLPHRPAGWLRPGPALLILALGVVAVAATFGVREGGGIERHSGFVHGREAQWSAAVDVAANHPLLGAGAEAYYAASLGEQGRSPVLYAHSLPLEVAAELGLAGLVALAVMLAGVGRALLAARCSPAFWLLSPGVLALPVASLVDWSWHLAGVGALWALVLGALLATADKAAERYPGEGTA